MLSVVIPLYNEELSLEKLYQELVEVGSVRGYAMEIIFVDDGSTDGSWQVIRRLAERDQRVRGIRFRRNFGKAAALDAGFAAAKGEYIITLDADLQDDPHEIPNLLAKLEEGFDLVSGWKQHRQDPWGKVIGSRIFNYVVRRLTGVHLHDHNCGMKAYRQEVIREVRLYGEMHRFVPVLAAARGFRVTEVPVRHRPRQFGRSKYGPTRAFKGVLDLLTVKFLTTFGFRPQHLLGTTGLIFIFLALLILLYCLGSWAAWWPGWLLAQFPLQPLAVAGVGLLVLGGQCIALGLVAEA
ncbi:MAG: glycosyltransferase family 2 protein, partial [Thermoguttaceae bacterium]|nr:glycosyltransferase family 2 protein [Thermoguttaceae bacterium]MDW8037999.1 glycosyltransferase family 2 protein [Thermoguttaceae bacterium]